MELTDLKNLGATSINWLNAAGISNKRDLEAIGPVEAYTRVKRLNIKVSKVFLYALYGALHDREWQNLTEVEKNQLVEQATERIEDTAPA